MEREGAEIALGVGEGGMGMDEERDPTVMGVGGFLEDPTAIGVETLAVTTFGIARGGSTEDRPVCESSVSCCSEINDKVGVSNRCGTDGGGGIGFGVSLECTAVREVPGFDGDSEADRHCFETGRNRVPPFSVRM